MSGDCVVIVISVHAQSRGLSLHTSGSYFNHAGCLLLPRAMIEYNYVFTATNDVQSAAASNGTNNKINLTGEFIESTTAQGCIVVLECEYGSPDVFRALLLPDEISTSVESTIHDVVSSTYHVLVYDLEEDGLPNSHHAVEQNTNVTVLGNGECLLISVHFNIHSISYFRSHC